MSQKYLFIDRDGTLISEPPSDYQVDRFDKLAFEPDAIPVLLALQKAGFKHSFSTQQFLCKVRNERKKKTKKKKEKKQKK